MVSRHPLHDQTARPSVEQPFGMQFPLWGTARACQNILSND
jgi:hypothetical protein